MKRRYLSLLCAAAMLLGGCSGRIASAQPPQGTTAPVTEGARGGLKTGLSIMASTAGSRDAAPGSEGSAQTLMTMVALTLDESGTIDQCIIDGLQADIRFDESGALLSDPETQFLSKNALGEAYGMKKASGFGREWSEQAAAFAEYVRGRTLEDVRSIALGEGGRPSDAELTASVTVSVNDFISGIEAAAASAAGRGARTSSWSARAWFTPARSSMWKWMSGRPPCASACPATTAAPAATPAATPWPPPSPRARPR